MIEYNKRQVYTFTVEGKRFNYFTINEADPYGDIIRDTSDDRTYFGKVNSNDGVVKMWSDRFGFSSEMHLSIDSDSISLYNPNN